MTSAATVFGHLPLVLVTGPGSAARNSIGTILVSGMIIGTVFTMFVVPVFYSLIAAERGPAHAREAATATIHQEAGARALEPAHA
jgi:multidrug efflux pump